MGITKHDIIAIPLQKQEILRAIEIAKNQTFLNNLRERHSNVSFDSKLRGYVGEIALLRWLKSHDIVVTPTNYVTNESGMDIDFIYKLKNKNLEIELKTSLIPDVDKTLEKALQKRDIKIIRRNNESLENLKSDVHIQLYYNQLRSAKDNWLITKNIDLNSNDLEYLYETLGARRYLTDTYLCAWIDKPTLISLLNNKPNNNKTWRYEMREFWNCNINYDAKKPLDLITYLQNI